MAGMNFRDAYEFDPEAYGGQGGLLGRLLALRAEQSRYQPLSGNAGQEPTVPPTSNDGQAPQTRVTVRPFDAYPPYDSESFGGGGGLLGRLLALQSEQSQDQPTSGNAGAPLAGTSAPQTQAQHEADQAQQAREAAAARLARGVRSLTRQCAAA